MVVSYLSRLDNIGEAIHVDDSFPDEHIFVVSTNSPWFADIANNIVIGKTLLHLFS